MVETNRVFKSHFIVIIVCKKCLSSEKIKHNIGQWPIWMIDIVIVVLSIVSIVSITVHYEFKVLNAKHVELSSFLSLLDTTSMINNN